MSEAERPSPPPRLGRKASSARLGLAGEVLAAAAALAALLEHVGVEARALELGQLLGGRDPAEQLVQGGDRLALGLLARPLDQGAELEQLEEAGDGAVDVLGGVEAHLPERRPGPPGRLEHLVANHPVGRVQALGRAEELLGVRLLGEAERGRRLVDRRGGAGAGLGLLGVGEHEAVGARVAAM